MPERPRLELCRDRSKWVWPSPEAVAARCPCLHPKPANKVHLPALGGKIDPQAVKDAFRSLQAVLLRRLDALRQLGEAALLAEIEVTPLGREHAGGMLDRVAGAIEHLT